MNIIQIYKQFPTHEDCLTHLEKVRWAGTPACLYCGSINSTPLKKEHRHHCNDCNTSYSVTVATIFHRTHLDLQKWFLALSLILNAKKGLSARQLARDIEVHRNTAWRISMQIRKAMSESAQRELLQGIVEMDECYIGGKPRKGSGGGGPHKRGRGTDKNPVVGMMERGGKVRAKTVKKSKLNAKSLSALVRANVDTNNTH
jgi:transposase-like protein